MQQFDAAVIGAGHNGLVAANYLADAGLDVVVLEKAPSIGGMTRSNRPIAAAPDHVINHCAVDPVFWPGSVPARELDLHKHGLRWIKVDPGFAYLDADGASIAFWQDPRRTADDIARFSASDADAYLELARLWDATCDIALSLFATNPVRPDLRSLISAGRKGLRHRKRLGEIGTFLMSAGNDVIFERFEHPIVRSALSLASGCLYPASYPGSSIQMLILAFVHRFGTLRPIGGTQAIPDSLAARLVSHGGKVLTDAAVKQISVTAGRATAVVLSDGREIQVRRAVLAACDPRQTLTQLLPAGAMSEREDRRAAVIPANDLGYGQLKVDLACSGQVDLSRFEKDRKDDANLRAASHLIGTFDGLEKAYRTAAAGLMPRPEDFGFYNAIPAAADPSQAPAGQDTVYLINITVPAQPEGGWTAERRDQAINETVGRAADFYGGLLDLEIGRSVFTNQDMAAEIGAESQSHVVWTINRLGPLRPAPGFAGYSTPVPGLYLGGAGCHPGAAVTGTPGYLGAREILRDIRRGERSRASVGFSRHERHE